MKYYLGVDGGGTKTKFLLSDENGIIKATTTKPTCHYLQVGFDGLSKVMSDGLQEILTSTNLTKDDISSVFVACAGYDDIKEHNKLIEEAIKRSLHPLSFSVGNDMENALAGSLGGQFGINVIAGTGSIGLGIDAQGNSFRSGGWHQAFGGDEGSAHWIGENLIRIFTRQSDERDEKTLLYSFIKEKLNFKSDSDILQLTIVDWKFDRTKIASLSTIAYELAKLGDKPTLDLFASAANELADIVIAIAKHLHFHNNECVSYSGGVFHAKEFILPTFKKRLEEYNLRLIEPTLSPAAGSIILAMKQDNVQINDTIIQNLKNEL